MENSNETVNRTRSSLKRSGSAGGRQTPSNMEERKSMSERNGRTDEIRRWYASLLTNHPWIAFLTTFLMVLLAGSTGFVTKLGAKPLPDFTSPGKGFEARGTVISTRILAHNNLYREMPGIVRLQTSNYIPPIQESKDSRPKESGCSFGVSPYMSSKTIYTTIDESESLLQAKSLREVCELEDEIVRKQPLFGNECEKADGNVTDCCPSISIGHYIAKLNNRTGCLAIVDSDVENFKELIKRHNSRMENEKFTEMEKDILENVLTFLVDKQFAKNTKSEKLTYTLVFSPVPTPSRNLLKGMYENKLQKIELLKKDKVKLVAYDFQNLKTVAYDSQLIADIWYIFLAVGLILCLMWGYSGSLFISIMGFSSVVFAIILSYWLYTVVFRLSFFPFLNIMTTVFVVGIGADDIFVYVLAWRHARQKFSQQDRVNATLAQCTEYALEHATAAMFVTSFTTATAFYAGLSSSITALQCFAIFAGTSILTNYFLMITWLPAVIIAQERFFARISCRKTSVKPLAQEHPGTSALSPKELADHNNSNNQRKCFAFNSSDIRQAIKDCSDVVFQKWIGQIVVKLRYCWLAIFLTIAMFGLLSLTYYPRLSLPTTQQIPLFVEDHSIERYDSVIKSKLKIEDLHAMRSIRFPVVFVWGAVDIDNGYFLNPSNTGKTEWDSSFSLMDEESQERMLQFCKKIRTAPFYDKELNNQSWCFMEALTDFIDSSKECENKTVPLKAAEFMECTKAYVTKNKNLPIKINSDGKIEALVMTFQSNRDYEMKFSPVEKFWKEVKEWAEKEIGNMPAGLKNGWVISSLYFYDLQKSIADGTIHTIIVSIAVSALVLLITTRNILITLYAVIAITAIISVTVGSLVMAGWQLNVFESMMISVAIGLSIDFTLHYGVAYFSCEQSQSRKERVHYSLWHVGSAVAMGTVTTFLAGLVMMPSVIHAYIQVGHFLMLIMSTSWVYSTFFFLALCAVLGPQGHFGDIIRCWNSKNSQVSPVKDAAPQESNTELRSIASASELDACNEKGDDNKL